MPTIAQKLCSDIVNPVLEQSSTPASYRQNTKNQNNGNPIRSVLIEKRKVIKKIIPEGTGRIVINKFNSKEKFKEFIDRSLNTIISGPLTSNNECLTNIHQRNNHCKYDPKTVGDTKFVQTSNVKTITQDKGCFHFTATTSCSTQFDDLAKYKDVMKHGNISEHFLSNIRRPHTSRTYDKPLYIDYSGARRWALSRYPQSGPDF